jgi:hypothetical protein
MPEKLPPIIVPPAAKSIVALLLAVIATLAQDQNQGK